MAKTVRSLEDYRTIADSGTAFEDEEDCLCLPPPPAIPQDQPIVPPTIVIDRGCNGVVIADHIVGSEVREKSPAGVLDPLPKDELDSNLKNGTSKDVWWKGMLPALTVKKVQLQERVTSSKVEISLPPVKAVSWASSIGKKAKVPSTQEDNTSPPCTPEKRARTVLVGPAQVDRYFTGDVRDGSSMVWGEAVGDKASSYPDFIKKGILYGALNALEPAKQSLSNARKMSPWGEHEAQDLRVGPRVDDSKKETTRQVVAAGGGPNKRPEVTTTKVFSSNRSLSVRAGVVASRVKNNGPRLVGILEQAGNQRSWTNAVVRSIAATGIGTGTIEKWTDSFQLDGKMSPQEAISAARQLEMTIKLWLSCGEPVAETDGHGGVDPGHVDNDMEAEDVSTAEEAFVKLVGATALAPSLVQSRICPICLFHELRGSLACDKSCMPIKVGVETWAYDLILSRITSGVGGDGWASACAEAHNREMHSQNGNIDRVSAEVGCRSELVTALRTQFWDHPVQLTHEQYSDHVLLLDSEKGLQRLYYSDNSNGSNTYYDICSTVHQCLGRPSDLDGVFMSSDEYLAQAREDLPSQSVPTTDPPAPVPSTSSVQARLLRPPQDPPPKTVQPGVSFEPQAARRKRVTGSARWVGVSYNRNFNHGCLVETDMGVRMVDAASRPDSTTPNILNPQRGNVISGYVSAAPIFGYLARTAEQVKVDWRDLGLKVALYDDLRCPDVIQPTGVSWAWASRDVPERKYRYLCDSGSWSFRGVFVSALSLAASMREHTNTLMVGHGQNTERWALFDDEVRVIVLGDNTSSGDVGVYCWIASHLQYPLLWCEEDFTITDVGVGGPGRKHAFIRTAGLVDIPSRCDKIIFVVPTQDRDIVSLAGHEFRIGKTDRHGNPDAQNPPIAYNMDATLRKMLVEMMQAKVSLRAAFERYSKIHFDGSLNWMEVDSLVTLLTVRWHQRVEAARTPDNNLVGRGAPPNTLEAVYHMVPDPDEVPSDRYTHYGGMVSVNSFDARYSTRVKVRAEPFIRIGMWPNIAELTIGTGVCRYKTFDVESPVMVQARLHSGLHDRVTRGLFLRKILECWKRDSGFRDEIAFPGDFPEIRNYWVRFIEGVEDRPGLANILGRVVTTTVTYSWMINHITRTVGSTLTGIRTSSWMWRTQLSTELGSFSTGHNGRAVGAEYVLDNRAQAWSYDHWLQPGQGLCDVALENVIMRLNLQSREWGFTYRAHPMCERIDGIAWVVEANIPPRTAKALGWAGQIGEFTKDLIWGWGLSSYIRDWANGNIKTLVIPRMTAVVYEASSLTQDTWLNRGAEEDYAGPGLIRDYLGRAPAWSHENIDKKLVTIDFHKGKDEKEPSADVPQQVVMEQLLKEIRDFRLARESEARQKHNFQDHTGPSEAAVLSALGTTSSGQDVVHPIVVAVETGAKSAISSTIAPPKIEGGAVGLGGTVGAEIVKEGEKRGIREAGKTA
ncbi:putative RdRp-complex [Linepithema humile toti-like virus 1]|nr:putative RdRp-complex [Linepithema humile toti-like virus 1]